MPSVFHLFADIAAKKRLLKAGGQLEEFPFSEKLVEIRWAGKFPDVIIRVNRDCLRDPLLCGGELIELKDAKSYTVSSFNSTIPTGEKNVADAKMEGIGAEILPVRQVYYFLRGRRARDGAVKACLVHGSFFETVKVRDLISDAFSQALASADSNSKLSAEERRKLAALMSSQEIFSTTRKVENSSVSLRFRIMSEVRKEANILKNYAEILDNTLNLIVPLHGDSETARNDEAARVNAAAQSAKILDRRNPPFTIKHPFNGYFWVRQIPIV